MPKGSLNWGKVYAFTYVDHGTVRSRYIAVTFVGLTPEMIGGDCVVAFIVKRNEVGIHLSGITLCKQGYLV